MPLKRTLNNINDVRVVGELVALFLTKVRDILNVTFDVNNSASGYGQTTCLTLKLKFSELANPNAPDHGG